MIQRELVFISFEPNGNSFTSFFSIEGILQIQDNPEELLLKTSSIYADAISCMRSIIQEINVFRAQRHSPPARLAWRLGDMIFSLKDDLEKLSLQINGMYDHLERDLGAKRKWLEKVIILRRYIPSEKLVSETLTWVYFEKGTQKKAKALAERSS